MPNSFTYKKSVTIKASAARVWQVLTNPDSIKKIYFGMDWQTNWQKGSTITFSGDYDHQRFEDIGTILDIKKEKFILFNYFSPDSGKADLPENYMVMRFELEENKNDTIFTVYQYGFKSEADFHTVITKWDYVLLTTKEEAERSA